MAVCRTGRIVCCAVTMLAMLWRAEASTAQDIVEFLQGACNETGSLSQAAKDTCKFFKNSSCYRPPGLDGCPEGCDLHVSACGLSDLCVDENSCQYLYPTGYIKVSNEMSYKECSPHCGLFGCDRCSGRESGRCEICHDHFTLITPESEKSVFSFGFKSGSCHWDFMLHAVVVLAVLTLMFVLLIISACRVHLRGNTNSAAVNAGMRSRYRAKVLQFFKHGHPKYKIWAPMHLHKTGRVPICGPGMTLFMNWFILWAGVGLWLTILAFWFTGEDIATDECPYAILRQFPGRADEVVTAKRPSWVALWAALAYLGSTLGSFVFFVTQRRLWTAMTHDATGEIPIALYTIEARGFPPEATDKDKLLQFFRRGLRVQHLPDDAIEYISIAYKYGEGDNWVEAALDRHLEQEQSSQYDDENMSYAEDSSSAESSEFDRSGPDIGPGWLQLLARLMLGTDMDWPVRINTQHQVVNADLNDDELEKKLNKLQSSGTVFVVLQTQALAVALQSVVKMPFRYEGGHPIYMQRARSVPTNINWHKFGIKKTTRVYRIVASVFILLFTAFFWFLCYLPMVWIYGITIDTAGSQVAYLIQTAMAMTIVIGNASLGYVANFVVEWIGFRMQRRLLQAKLMILVPLMLLNVWFDLLTVVYLPTFHYFHTWRVTCSIPSFLTKFDPHEHNCEIPVAEFVHELQSNAASLLSSYCVVPYVGEPLFCIFGFFLVGMWRVKRDRRITEQQAEKLMLAPTTDIVNPPFCDIICTTTIIVFTFTMGPSRQHRFIFPWILVAAAVLYVQCRFRILRWESRSYYGSRTLHDVESVYWALPLGLLAAAWERNMETNSAGSLLGWRFFCIHLFMHLLFLRFVVPQYEPQMPASRIEYKKALRRLGGKASLADYLNTNPIEVLKSHFQPEISTGQHLIYYRLDKEHLQKRASHSFKNEQEFRKQHLSLSLSPTVFESRALVRE